MPRDAFVLFLERCSLVDHARDKVVGGRRVEGCQVFVLCAATVLVSYR